MLTLMLTLTFLSTVGLILGVVPLERVETRPRLRNLAIQPDSTAAPIEKKKKRISLFRKIAFFNKPLSLGLIGRRISRDLGMARIEWLSVEEFLLIKEIAIALMLLATRSFVKPDMVTGWICGSVALGFILPELWLKGKIRKVRRAIIRELPDVIDLLGLCVNAGLDFMLALKWVVEKSKPSILTGELNLVMQEINVGKTRRSALFDLAKKYGIPDLSTFSRTLIQADRMGTSMAEALNILSEDMRQARYRRGEQIAAKAPIKMLVPLLLFIFPVVAILVAGPILLDFLHSNPFKQIGQGLGTRSR